MADSSSNWLMMRLLAVRDRPSVATRAVRPITIPSMVRVMRTGRANIPAIASFKEIAKRDAGAGNGFRCRSRLGGKRAPTTLPAWFCDL